MDNQLKELIKKYKVTDNYSNHLARMSDGRTFTSYLPNCLMNKAFSKGENSYQSRLTLIKNTDEILETLDKVNIERYSCEDCNKATIPSVKYEQDCESGSCKITKLTDNGIGMF